MKYLFLMRVDSATKSGGDTYQVDMYKNYLSKLGVKVDVSYDLSVKDGYDNYIIVNLDRPLELIIYTKKLMKKGLLDKTSLLSIHHDYDAISSFEKNKKGLLNYLFNFIFRSFFSREKIKNGLRSLKEPSLFPYYVRTFFCGYKKFIFNVISNYKYIILIAEGEKKIIEKDFGIIIDNSILVKNGVDINELDLNLDTNAFDRTIDVLVCGRIEPRKNCLQIVQVLNGKPFNVQFVGGLNENSKTYCNQFLSAVESSSNITYLGKLTPSELVGVYKNSKVHLSASWFEVASLVDLEASAYGCNIISSINGHTKDYINNINYINPENLSLLPSLITDLIDKKNSNDNYKTILNHYTWAISAKKLLTELESIEESC